MAALTGPRRRSWRALGLILLAVVTLSVAPYWWRTKSGGSGAAPGNLETSQPRAATHLKAEAAALNIRTMVADVRHRLAADPSAGSRLFEELRSKFAAAPAKDAAAAIREFLDTKADAPSGQEFKVGPNGFLTTHSSFRVFLLDQLARIDPGSAAVYAKTILSSLDSPDEWAIALRTSAELDSTAEGRTFVAERLKTMWSHEPWLQQPSMGFLEAFDVAVYLGGTDLVPKLAGLVRDFDNRAAAHAAYLALDRLTIADAGAILGRLQQNPELMQGRESTRANYFARADVRDASQRQIIETYLLDPALSPAELQTFAALYPSGNYMVSHNLLTSSTTPDRAWLVARDTEALRHVGQMLENSRFARIKPQLETMRRRLELFVTQAHGSESRGK